MPSISRSAKLYQERRQPGIVDTLRGPGPQLYIPHNPATTLNLKPPLPVTAAVRSTNGNPPPDAGRSVVWPFGDEYAP